jgi:deoxyribose-phosphate aldolase
MAEHHHDHEHCECHHEHHHAQPESRIEEALKKYNLDITDEYVKAAVQKLIAEKVPENDTGSEEIPDGFGRAHHVENDRF